MNVYDIFIVCNMTIVYDFNMNRSKILFYDIITNLPIIIPSTIMMELSEYIQLYTNETNELPNTISLFGNFVRDSKCIYVTELESMHIMNIKATTCYLEKNSNGIRLIDESTTLEVKIETNNKNEYTAISNILMDAYKDHNCNFTNKGNDRLTCIGLAKCMDGFICYNTNDMFHINTPQMITYQLYMQFINSELDSSVDDE